MLCFVLLLSYHGCVSAYIGKFTLRHETNQETILVIFLSTLHALYVWHVALC